MPMPSFRRHFGTARIGATSTYFMSSPADAWAPTAARTRQPSAAAVSSAMTTAAAAPSLITEALPAVANPFFWKAGLILANSS